MGSCDRGDQVAATLIAGATRMAGLSNAVALLCRYGRGVQSESLVRSMVVTALAMCWAVSVEDLGEALGKEADELQAWRSEDAAAPTPDRLELVGLTDSECEAAEAVLRRMELSSTGTVLVAVGKGATPEEALLAANRAMAAALWALEKRWPGTFTALPFSGAAPPGAKTPFISS
ncbi:MAG: hypothetical protein AAB262_14980 [Elusimicrobiota bacterium]